MADIISLLYAFNFPKKFYIAIIIPFSSLVCYFPFLYRSSTSYILGASIVLFIVIIDLLYSFRIHLLYERSNYK